VVLGLGVSRALESITDALNGRRATRHITPPGFTAPPGSPPLL
jgi:hypothetical protein